MVKKAMSGVRVPVEWFFKETRMYCMLVDIKRMLLLVESAVGNLCISVVLLANIRKCVYPNTI